MSSLSKTYPLVRAVRAVGFAVAAPLGRDAVVLRAGKLLQRVARGRLAALLVAVVTAVVVPVALPPLLDAPPVGTGEFVRTAGFIW